jgi:hypothetical protein
VFHAIISARWEVEAGGFGFQASLSIKHEILPEKSGKAKRAAGMIQVVEHMPHKHKALTSKAH